MTDKKFSGAGGMLGGGSTPTDTDDNLFSTDIVEALLGVSEGPIKGLKNGAKSFLVGDTPLKNVDNKNNFDAFELVIRKGSELGESITSRMGGFGSSTNVGTELTTNTPVVRSGTHMGIDFIDIRLLISRLMIQDEGSTFEHTGKIKVEYKASLSPTWLPVKTGAFNPPPAESTNPDGTVYTGKLDKVYSQPSPGDRVTIWQATKPPVTTGNRKAIWFDTSNNNKPYGVNDSWWSGTDWQAMPSSSYSSGVWTWNEKSSWGKDKATRAFTQEKPPSTKEQGDYWLRPSQGRVYFFNGSTWIIAGGSLTPGRFGSNSTGGDVTVNEGELRIKGKTTTPFVKEFRFRVPKLANDTYQVRVTKTSALNTSEKFFDVSWESFQEVSGKVLNFPGLATAQLTARASEQFSSVPDFSGIYEGRVIKVPTIYDPETRTYSGSWNGTSTKMVYTNNPAFIVQDLVENDRYGLNSYYPVVLNKWDVLEAAQWCDTLNENGQPRFTFNALIAEPRGCREAIEYICGTFGGRFIDDGNGFANIRIDKDGTAAKIFSPENVIDGVFTYSWTDVTTRFNDITVVFNNPALNYKEDRRRVFDQEAIDANGRIPLNFVAIGCNSAAEAITRGKYKLVTSISETLIANFKTNRQGLYLNPYDIILIADEDMQLGNSGRVLAKTNATTFSLRDPVYLEAGFNYKVQFSIPDANGNTTVVDRLIAPGTTGSLSQIVTTTSLPTGVGPDTVFLLSTTNNQIASKAFRVTSITEVNGDPDNVEIQAVEVNRLKWDYIDGLVTDFEEPEVIDMGLNTRPEPVSNLRVTSKKITKGPKKTHTVTLDWDASPTRVKRGYRIYASRDNGSTKAIVSLTTLTKVEIDDLVPGEYLFSVVTVGMGRLDSDPIFIEHRLIGDYRDVPTITNLRLLNATGTNQFASRSPQFAWDISTEPDKASYLVRISNLSDVVLREVTTSDESFTYLYEDNRIDFGGTASRSFKISVLIKDQFGAASEPVTLTVNNPAPAGAAATFIPGSDQVTVRWTDPTEADYSGMLVYYSTVQGFALGTATVIDTKANYAIFPANPATTYYVRIAPYDTFNKAGLNVSSEYSVTTIASSFDTTPPAVPAGLALSSNSTLTEAGDVVVTLIATWTANVESDLAYYDIQLKEATGSFIGFSTSTNRMEWKVKPNTLYTAQIRAFDALGNKSNLSTAVTHTSARDTVAPAQVTGLTANALFKSIWFNWTGVADKDLAYYEVYIGTNSTAPVAGSTTTIRVAGTSYILENLAVSTARWAWVRGVDTSGNKGTWSALATATTLQIATGEIGPGAIAATAFAADIAVPIIVATLPAITGTSPKQVYLTTDKTLYVQNAAGTAWVNQSDASLIVGQIVAGQIAAGAIGADQIAAGAISTEKLTVLGKNLINPVSGIGNINGWGGITETGTGVSTYASYDATEDALKISNGAGLNVFASPDAFFVDPNKIYRVMMRMKKSVATGRIYFGVRSLASKFLGTSATGAGNQGLSFTPYNASRVAQTSGFNVYFHYSVAGAAPTDYTDYVTYIIGANRDIKDVPDHNLPAGTVVNPYLKASAPLWAAVRVLNYDNAGAVTDVFVKSPSISEVGTGQIVADNIKAQAIEAGHIKTGALEAYMATIGTAFIQSAYIIDLDAAKIKAGSILSGSVLVDGRAINSLNGSAYTQNFSGSAPWNVNTGAAPTFVTEPTSVSGSGKVLQSTVSGWLEGPDLLPFDPNTMYRVRFRVKRKVAGAAGLLYLGLVGYAADGVTRVSPSGASSATTSQYWIAASAVAQDTLALDTWVEYVGYIKGTATPGTVVLPTSPTVPAKMHSNVRFMRPVMAINYTAGTSTMQVDIITVDALTEEAGALVNAGTTLIQPGKITIGTGVNLGNWIKGGTTLFDGAMISANTVKSNVLDVGLRNLTIRGIVFNANDPSPNYVSWTDGFIDWINDAGVATTTTIAAGQMATAWTTGIRYIIWAKGAAGLTETSSVAAAYAPDVVPIAAYKGGLLLDPNFGRTIIDGSEIRTGSIYADRLNVTSLLAQFISAKSINGEMMSANTISARHMVLSNMGNMLPDNALQDASAWNFSNTTSFPDAYLANNSSATGKMIRFDGAGTPGSGESQNAYSQYFTAYPGDELSFGGVIDLNTDDNQQVRIYLYYYDSAGTLIDESSVAAPAGVGLSAIKYTGSSTVPALTDKMRMRVRRYILSGQTAVAGTAYVYNLFVKSKVDASLVVAGSIDTTQLAAGAVTASKIGADAITAGKIDAGAINTKTLFVNGVVWTDAIQTGAVTAANVSTSTGQSSTSPDGFNQSVEKTLVTYTINPVGDRLIVTGSAKVWTLATPSGLGGHGGPAGGTMRLFKGSTVKATMDISMGSAERTQWTMIYVDNDPSDATWTLRITPDANTDIFTYSHRYIQYLNAKR